MRLTYILEELIFILCARHTHTYTLHYGNVEFLSQFLSCDCDCSSIE